MTTLQRARVRAPRATIVNVATGASRKMQFNPTELEESLSVNYARQQVPGLSHEVLQFINTGNRTFDLNLYFDEANSDVAESFGNRVLSTRKYFRSLVYPREVGGLVGGGAPRVLMVFPAFVTITAVITSLKMRYVHWNDNGVPSRMNVTLELEELREVMRLSEEVEGIDNE